MGSVPVIRIFVSSPGDVAEERVLAKRVLNRLADEFSGRAGVEAVFWEHEPLVATDTFQSQIVRPSETDIVICILWSRLGTRLPRQISRPDGSRYNSGTEYEFEDAVEARRQTGTPDLIVYRKTAVPLVSLDDDAVLEQRRAQKRALDEFVNKWFHDASEGTLIAAFHPFDSSAQFEERLEEHLRKLIQRRLPAAPAAGPVSRPTWTGGSPFRGLELFEFEHAPVYFGRTKATGDVLNALRLQAAANRPFVMILGASGSGKSSLVRAGVLPLLTQPGVIEGVGVWRRAIVRPGDSPDDPFASLAAALLAAEALPELSDHETSAPELATLLRQSPSAAMALIKGALSRRSPAPNDAQGARLSAARLVVVLDQLEELFTLETVSADDRSAFGASIATLVRSGRVWVIATLRNDFYARLSEMALLAELKEGAGQYDLALPTRAEVAQMIRRPALAAGLRFEEDPSTGETLDDVLRDAAIASPESLPLLEFTLEELYKRRTPDGRLTHEAYRSIGGLEGALANRAETVFAALPQEVQSAMPSVFRALVSVGGPAVTEAVASRQASAAAVGSTPAASAFGRAFIDARLFSTDRTPDGEAIVGVTHEALLRRWPRLQEWLEQDRELLRVRSRVLQAAARWRAEGRRGDLLLPQGKPLEEATDLLRAVGDDLSADDRAFIAASQARARNRRRVKRTAIAALACLAVVAAAGAIVANIARRDAQAQRGRAETARSAAESERRRADDERFAAEAALADRTLAEADARAAEWRWDDARAALQRAVPLFQRAGRSTLPLELRLWQSYRLSPPAMMTLRRPQMSAVALSADGRRAATGHLDGSIAIWDVPSGQMTGSLALQKLPISPGSIAKINPYAITALAISADGKQLLAAGKDLRLTLWDLQTNEIRHKLVGHQNSIFSAAISPDGTMAVSGGWSHEVHAWNLQSGEELWFKPHLRPARGGAEGVVYLAGGKTVAVLLRGAGVALYDARTGDARGALDAPVFANTTCIAAGPDPDLLALGDAVGGVRLASIGSRAVTMVLAGHRAATMRVAFSPDGRQLISAGSDGLIRLWGVRDGRQIAALPGAATERQDLALSADGRFIAVADESAARVRALSASRGESLTPCVDGPHQWHSCEISPRQRLAAVVGGGGVQVIDLFTGKVLRQAKVPILRYAWSPPVLPIRFTRDDSAVVFGDDTSLWTLDLLTGKLSQRDVHDKGNVIGISDDAEELALQRGNDVTLVDRAALTERQRIPTTQAAIRAELCGRDRVLITIEATRTDKFAFFPSWIAFSGHRLMLWDRLARRAIGSVEVEGAQSSATALVGRGPRALVALGGTGPAIIDLVAGSSPTTLPAPGGGVVAADLMRHGQVAVGVAADHTVHFWDVDSGKSIAVQDAPDFNASALAASAQGRWLVITGNSRSNELAGATSLRDLSLQEAFAQVERQLAAAGMPFDDAASNDPPTTRPTSQPALDPSLLGQWYALQGLPDWAAPWLAEARGPHPSAALARAWWLSGNTPAAATEFAVLAAQSSDGIEANYYHLCADACRRER